jgi:hypothetical protein
LFKINPPYVDDLGELQKLANNKKVGSYPDLMHHYIEFKNQYQAYTDKGGDPWQVTSLTLDVAFKDALKVHYDNPPDNSLEFIDDFRRDLSPTICPMCGGFGNGTLDHYLPQANYPEFKFLSKNLVPACNCNSLRSTKVQGVVSPARAIHPFYDNFLDDRLYQVVFTGSYEAPTITIDVVNPNHPNIDILKFHLDEVILNVATQGWLEKFWADLTRRPHDILDIVLPVNHLDGIILFGSIERLRNAKDKEHGTPNNWHSMFYTGLLNDQVRIGSLAATINDLR